MKKKLMSTATSLVPPKKAAAERFQEKREMLTAECTLQFEERDDIDQLIGEHNLQMAKDNNRNFSRFMAAILADYEPELLVETVLWVFTAYRSHGFRTTYWAANLNIWVDVLKRHLPAEDYAEIYPFYNWLIIHIPIFVKLTDHAENSDAPAHDIKTRHPEE